MRCWAATGLACDSHRAPAYLLPSTLPLLPPNSLTVTFPLFCTQGGGFGLLGRYAGLACDSLVGLEMVLANGTVVKANKSERWQQGAQFWHGAGAHPDIRTYPCPVPQSALLLRTIGVRSRPQVTAAVAR